MPGGKGFVDSPAWFETCFGFKEGPYLETHGKFKCADGDLTSLVNNVSFHVGDFEIPSLGELRGRHGDSKIASDGQKLTFEHVTGNAKTLILDPVNADAVFQVASQFNCLEMNEPGARPEDGVTRYYCDATQGPACALACPAATVFRNYFVNEGIGQRGKYQIDCLADIGELLGASKNKLWKMRNGYCLPDAEGGIAKAGAQISGDPELAEKIHNALRIGVHWDTEVKGGSHRVCQVFSSALPLSYAKAVKSKDWESLAQAVLNATFEATLAVAMCLAQTRDRRVPVFLTGVGGGAFGNRSLWIQQAIDKALGAYAEAPLDVKLVHFGTATKSAYAGLEKGRQPPKSGPKACAKKGLPNDCKPDSVQVQPKVKGGASTLDDADPAEPETTSAQ